MRRAGAIAAGLPQAIRDAFRPRMTELDLAAALEYYCRRQGHSCLVRCRREGVEMSSYGIVTAGVNSLAGTKFDGVCGGTGLSAAVPFGATLDPITPGAPIVVDFAVTLEGYHADQTRLCCWGTPSPEIRAAYEAMLRVQAATFDRMQSGVPWEDIYGSAVALAAELGYADTFMGMGTERVRFVGHGVGLELDEPPFLAPRMRDPLEEGMVIAVEPKVALPHIGVVGIEDTVIVGADGIERITDCSQEIIELG